MLTIDFIVGYNGRRILSWGNDNQMHGVRYTPSRGIIQGSIGSFEQVLIEAVNGLPKHNSEKLPVEITIPLTLSKKNKKELKKVFGDYAKTEQVDVSYRQIF